MAGSCCGGTSKSENAKVVAAPALKTAEEITAQQAAKSECCADKPQANGEKQGCGCS